MGKLKLAELIQKWEKKRDQKPDFTKYPISVPDVLNSYMADNRLNQLQFANLTGIKPGKISLFVNMRKPLSINAALKIEANTGIKAEYLLTIQAEYKVFLERKKRQERLDFVP